MAATSGSPALRSGYNQSLNPMGTPEEPPARKAGVLPPPPAHSDDGPTGVRVPPLEPPPSSLKAVARRRNSPGRDAPSFWVLMLVLFAAGTALTFYLQK
jgi:hypothetical protein